jgi:hypothetical protein
MANLIHSDNELTKKLEPADSAEAGPSNDELKANSAPVNGGSPTLDGGIKPPERQNVNAIREALETQAEMEVGKPIAEKAQELKAEEAANSVQVDAKPGKQIIINIAGATDAVDPVVPNIETHRTKMPAVGGEDDSKVTSGMGTGAFGGTDSAAVTPNKLKKGAVRICPDCKAERGITQQMCEHGVCPVCDGEPCPECVGKGPVPEYCSLCKSAPCRCDQIYEDWRDRQMERRSSRTRVSYFLGDKKRTASFGTKEASDRFVAGMKTKYASEFKVADMPNTVEGWSNWETSALYQHMINTESSFSQYRDLARKAVWRRLLPSQLADQYRRLFQKQYRMVMQEAAEWEDVGGGGPEEPNWFEIAENAIEEVKSDQGNPNFTPEDMKLLEKMKIKGSLKKVRVSYTMTNVGEAVAVCPKCRQRIRDGEMVNWTSEGQEAHIHCPPPRNRNAGEKPSANNDSYGSKDRGMPMPKFMGITEETAVAPKLSVESTLSDEQKEINRRRVDLIHQVTDEMYPGRKFLSLDNEEQWGVVREARKRMKTRAAGDGESKTEEQVEKEAGFNFFFPGQVMREFYPELQHELVDYPNATNAPMQSPEITGEGGHDLDQMEGVNLDGAIEQALDTGNIQAVMPEDAELISVLSYESTSPAGAAGIGRDGKTEVLEGAPLRKENDIRGYMFTDEFYNQYEGVPGALMSVAHKVAAKDEATQFAMFLKKVCGEIAATMVACFKVTSRPLLNKVPGVGEVQLANVEQPSGMSSFNIVNTGSRVKYLLDKLTDSEIQDAINDAWAQAAVWHDGAEGGFVYEVFVRPENIDTDTMIMTYKFIAGTKE